MRADKAYLPAKRKDDFRHDLVRICQVPLVGEAPSWGDGFIRGRGSKRPPHVIGRSCKKMQSTSFAVQHETRSRWVLVDFLNPAEPGLLSIGDVNYSGSSVRKNLDPRGRELLMDRIRDVAASGRPVDEEVSCRGLDYQVLVEPVRAPTTNMVMAVLACYTTAGEELPPRPLIGALEWKISFDGHIDTCWNDDLFEIYELDRSGSSPTGDMNQWVGELISPEDRTRMKVTIDAAIASVNAQRHLVPYKIITRAASDNPGLKNLEVSGRVVPDTQRNGKWLRAITREVNGAPLSPITPGFGDLQTSKLLRAVFELASGVALMAVDVSCWQTFMTSENWQAEGLRLPQFGYLPHVVHPDDFKAFRDLVEAGNPRSRAVVRMLQVDSSYASYSMSASSGQSENEGEQRYSVVLLFPLRLSKDTGGSAHM